MTLDQKSGVLIVGAVTFLLVVVVATIVPYLYGTDPNQQQLASLFEEPFQRDHFLGTDSIGRDLAARILHGARASLLIAGVGMILAMTVGTAVGFLSSFTEGFPQLVLLRLIDTQMAFPYVLLAIAVTSAIRPSIPILILLMALAGWAPAARVVRSAVLQELGKDYPKAAKVLGASRWRVAIKYVLPSVSAIVIALAPLVMAKMIVIEATLSFLGMGIQPPTPSWGIIMFEGRPYIQTAWWVTTLPGFAIMSVVGSLLAVGSGLDQSLSQRRSRRTGAVPAADPGPASVQAQGGV